MAESGELQFNVTGHDGARVLAASGEVNLTTSPELQQALFKALEGTETLKVHLAEVSFIDSSGIAALVRAYKRAQELGATLVLAQPSEAVTSVLELTNLDSLFHIEAGSER